MELYLLRHAIAEPKTGAVPISDSQRRLTPEGVKKMRRAAKGMKAAKFAFDLILSSPWLRARETADIVAEVLDLKKECAGSAALAGNGNPKELIDELKRDYRGRQSILLVGHEPYLSRFISVLVNGDSSALINLKKGGLCKLTVKFLHYGRCATLEWLLTSDQLRRMK